MNNEFVLYLHNPNVINHNFIVIYGHGLKTTKIGQNIAVCARDHEPAASHFECVLMVIDQTQDGLN